MASDADELDMDNGQGVDDEDLSEYDQDSDYEEDEDEELEEEEVEEEEEEEDEDEDEEDDVQDSATEIETDSEFDQNSSVDVRPTEIPTIVVDESEEMMLKKSTERLSSPDHWSQLNGNEPADAAPLPANNALRESAADATPDPSYVKQYVSLEPARPANGDGPFVNFKVNKSSSTANLTSAQAAHGILAYLRRHEMLERLPLAEAAATAAAASSSSAANSLQLRKKHLQEDAAAAAAAATKLRGPPLSAQKSASVANLDVKLRSCVDSISEVQKLLHPAPQPSVPMQVFLQNTANLFQRPTVAASDSPAAAAPLAPPPPPPSSHLLKETPVQEEELDAVDDDVNRKRASPLPPTLSESSTFADSVVSQARQQNSNGVQAAVDAQLSAMASDAEIAKELFGVCGETVLDDDADDADDVIEAVNVSITKASGSDSDSVSDLDTEDEALFAAQSADGDTATDLDSSSSDSESPQQQVSEAKNPYVVLSPDSQSAHSSGSESVATAAAAKGLAVVEEENSEQSETESVANAACCQSIGLAVAEDFCLSQTSEAAPAAVVAIETVTTAAAAGVVTVTGPAPVSYDDIEFADDSEDCPPARPPPPPPPAEDPVSIEQLVTPEKSVQLNLTVSFGIILTIFWLGSFSF